MSLIREQGLDLEALGLNREELQRRLRQVLRQRLNEQTRAAANRICNALGERAGHQPLQRDAKRERFRTNAVRRRAAHWRPHRHHAHRPGLPPQCHRTRPPRRTRAMRRMLSNCVPATTCSHSGPRPTHFDAHRVIAFVQREHVRTQSRFGSPTPTHTGWAARRIPRPYG